MLDRFISFWTSLRLTVVCLAFSIVLVFVGTIAQADEGLYQAQERYFKHWLVWGISFFGKDFPLPLPGGYLLGTVLIVNLTAAHIKRFQLSWKKLGIHLTHGGLILLLIGQLATDLLSRETQMRFSEGETKWYSEDPMNYELAFVHSREDGTDKVVAIAQSKLVPGTTIRHPELPFDVFVETFWRNSEPAFRAPMSANAPPITTNGLAQSFDFRELAVTKTMDDKNVPTGVIELRDDGMSLGRWVVSGWAGDEVMVAGVRRFWMERLGAQPALRMVDQLTQTQAVAPDGQSYRMSLRPIRHYKPYSMTLLERTHEVYPGTDIPKNFQSRVQILNPEKNEDREVDIYMNNPLRYSGLTFYQYQMSREEAAADEHFSTLQVVRNPSWLTPYIGCILVGAGLIAQFMMHLVAFIKRRTA